MVVKRESFVFGRGFVAPGNVRGRPSGGLLD